LNPTALWAHIKYIKTKNEFETNASIPQTHSNSYKSM
jgi:hypothetical protein